MQAAPVGQVCNFQYCASTSVSVATLLLASQAYHIVKGKAIHKNQR